MVKVYLKDGSIIEEQKEVADAHPSGNRPFVRANYIEKFKTLTDGIISSKESARFLRSVQNLKKLNSKDLHSLNVQVLPKHLKKKKISKETIF